MNNNFSEYFEKNFFPKKEELERFLKSLNKSLVRTIRVNLNKISIENLKNILESQNYNLKSTFQENVFYVERWEKFDELERRLGFTLEHLLGYFYIQELGASSSVFYLADWKIDKNPYLILDVAASPGGKTTQLSEYYPNSFVVANEFDKNRTAQLIANIDRMGCQNVGVTNYNWQFLWRLEETFDKILLDAPCSWEWIAFKNEESLKFWNIKNIKKIADIQFKLLESSLSALKVSWELLYSTCTMNKIENEENIEILLKKYPGSFEVVFEKRFWPHIDETWWFFVCKIKKLKSIDYKYRPKDELSNEKIKKLSTNDEKYIEKFSKKTWLNLEELRLFKYENEILAVKKDSPYNIKDRLYFFRFGQKLGKIEWETFVPNYYIGRDFGILDLPKYNIIDENELDKYLRWAELQTEEKWDFIQIIYKETPIWLAKINSDWVIKNNFPAIWLRK